MDVCCYNRPFDDLSQERVYLETEAILHIISLCDSGEWELASSGAIDFELSQITDDEKYKKTLDMISSASVYADITDESIERAKQFQGFGIKRLDSYHLALAEKMGTDVFLTTDDRFIKSASRTNAKVKVINPVKWLMEVMSDE
jgi:hypothetical protein